MKHMAHLYFSGYLFDTFERASSWTKVFYNLSKDTCLSLFLFHQFHRYFHNVGGSRRNDECNPHNLAQQLSLDSLSWFCRIKEVCSHLNCTKQDRSSAVNLLPGGAGTDTGSSFSKYLAKAFHHGKKAGGDTTIILYTFFLWNNFVIKMRSVF